MRTRLSGGVAGVEGETLPPYADRGGYSSFPDGASVDR